MSLVMTDQEIADSYRTAADPRAQLNVLAELNGLSGIAGRKKIVEALERAGAAVAPPRSRRSRAHLSQEEMQTRRRLYDQGLTDAEIAEALHATRPAIAQWRKKKGLPAR